MKIVAADVIVCSPGRNVVTYLEEYVIPCLIGRDAHKIEDTWQYFYRGAYWRRGPIGMTALAAT